MANEFSNKNESSQVPVKEDENKNHLGPLANLVSALFPLPPKNQTVFILNKKFINEKFILEIKGRGSDFGRHRTGTSSLNFSI